MTGNHALKNYVLAIYEIATTTITAKVPETAKVQVDDPDQSTDKGSEWGIKN